MKNEKSPQSTQTVQRQAWSMAETQQTRPSETFQFIRPGDESITESTPENSLRFGLITITNYGFAAERGKWSCRFNTDSSSAWPGHKNRFHLSTGLARPGLAPRWSRAFLAKWLIAILTSAARTATDSRNSSKLLLFWSSGSGNVIYTQSVSPIRPKSNKKWLVFRASTAHLRGPAMETFEILWAALTRHELSTSANKFLAKKHTQNK